MIRAVTLSLVAILTCLIFGRLSASSKPAAQRLVYTSAARYDVNAWLTGGERFPAGARILLADGKDLKQLVPGFAASADPEVSFDGTRILFAGKKRATDRWQIWEISLDGSEPRQVFSTDEDVIRPLYLPDGFIVYTRRLGAEYRIEKRPLEGGTPAPLFFAPGSAITTDVLRDGRILFETGYPLGGSVPEIYTVYSDGSGVESYRCDHGHARFAGRQVLSGDIVFATDSGLARFASPLAHEVAVPTPKGTYAGDVTETGDGWIVSRRIAPSKPFELVQWDPASRLERPIASSTENLVQARVLAPRPTPNRHPSALHEWRTTNLLALNVYTSKYTFAKDSVASVRLYTMSVDGVATILGTAPVEKDGSFYIKAPGDQPLKFELLDRSGKTLKKQAGWMWARAGEQRICVGCHAGPEHAPDNAVPEVLLHSTTPADLTGGFTKALAGGH